MKRLLVHITLWLAVLGFWVLVSHHHHPTWLLNTLASTILVSASAAAVYANALVLRPRYRGRRDWILYVMEFILLVGMLDLMAVFSIQWVYDMLWGPDPARYGFWKNVGLEAVFIGLHLAVAVITVWVCKTLRKDRSIR